jgi:predicted outer membrane repeat protein
MKKITFTFLLLIPLVIFGQIINIPGDYNTIQEGIDNAEPGDTILVAAGTYYENIYAQSKNFVLASHFILEQDTNYISQTIIDGNAVGSVIHFDNVSSQSEIIGLTIQNGDATGGFGGGIQLIESSPILRNLLIKDNVAGSGGGIYCTNWSLNLYQVKIVNNTALNFGGGIFTMNAALDMNHCTLTGNHALTAAGGMFRFNIEDVINYGMNVNYCSIKGNTAETQTAGLFFRRTEGVAMVEINLMGCVFENNYAASNGALQIRGEEVGYHIENCKFIHNQVDSYSAGLAFIMGCSGRCINCIIAQNEAALNGEYWNGGGCTFWGSEGELLNCDFIANKASYGAGVVVGPNSEAFVVNCIFRDNQNEQISVLDFNDMGGVAHVFYSNIHYGLDSVRVDPLSLLDWGENNIDADPLFTGIGDDEYALSEGSPCIDAGQPDTTGMNLSLYDLLMNYRVWDGDGNGSAIIDMGAYEFDSPAWVGVNEPGIPSVTSQLIQDIFPNPAKEHINIICNEKIEGPVRIRLFSAGGMLVKHLISNKVLDHNYQINLQGLSPGIYFIRLQSDKASETAKIIILD